MNNYLKAKLQSWSVERVIENSGGMPIIPHDHIDNLMDLRITEWDDNGVYSTGLRDCTFYKIDGTIEIVVDASVIDASNDFNVLKQLYDLSKSAGNFRTVEPLSTDADDRYVTILQQVPASANGGHAVGQSMVADYLANCNNPESFNKEDWVKQAINRSTQLIKALDQLKLPYPQKYSYLDHLKDDIGYYFAGMYGFVLTKEQFVQEQLDVLKTDPTPRTLFAAHGLDADRIADYAEQQWTR